MCLQTVKKVGVTYYCIKIPIQIKYVFEHFLKYIEVF